MIGDTELAYLAGMAHGRMLEAGLDVMAEVDERGDYTGRIEIILDAESDVSVYLKVELR